MEFVGNIVDFGTAKEFHVSNICRIALASENIVRVTYSVRHKQPTGKDENRVVLHLDWDKAHWSMLSEIYRAPRSELLGTEHERLFAFVGGRNDH